VLYCTRTHSIRRSLKPEITRGALRSHASWWVIPETGTWAARPALMSCQIKDYQGAPLKMYSRTVPLSAPPSAVCKTCHEMAESIERIRGTANGLEDERRWMKCWQSRRTTQLQGGKWTRSKEEGEKRRRRKQISGTLSELIFRICLGHSTARGPNTSSTWRSSLLRHLNTALYRSDLEFQTSR